jgi:hypothetical protein
MVHHQRGHRQRLGLRQPGGGDNTTGGSGDFAVVDSDHDGFGSTEDATLTTPVMDLTTDPTPIVQFAQDFVDGFNDTTTVDLSTNDGHTWTTVATQTVSQPGPTTTAIPIPQAAASRASASDSTTRHSPGPGGGRSTTSSSETAAATPPSTVASSLASSPIPPMHHSTAPPSPAAPNPTRQRQQPAPATRPFLVASTGCSSRRPQRSPSPQQPPAINPKPKPPTSRPTARCASTSRCRRSNRRHNDDPERTEP